MKKGPEGQSLWGTGDTFAVYTRDDACVCKRKRWLCRSETMDKLDLKHAVDHLLRASETLHSCSSIPMACEFWWS